MSLPTDLRVVHLKDERAPLARSAFELIKSCVWEVQPMADLLAEMEEGRRGLATGGDYHVVALVGADGVPVAAATGAFLEAVNAGYIAYLAVAEEYRNARLGREIRRHLVEAFRTDAQRLHGGEPAFVVGEVRRENRWLETLVDKGRAITFDLPYFHPWMPMKQEGVYVLYREPLGDPRPELPSREVVALLYAIWRRAYRISYPTQSETFCYMLDKVESKDMIGPDPEFLTTA